jgi:4-alpha-glucanotransferase
MDLPRSSGVLLHPTSLPGGRLGAAARRFVDWLAAAGQSWWQMLPLGPPDAHRSPYGSSSAFAAWPGLLEKPNAHVGVSEIEDFVARHATWIGGWSAFAGPRAIADQVRFEREWRALRAYAAAKGVRLIGDIPIYVASKSADHATWPEIFARGEVAGVPADAFGPDGQLWGNPLYDWTALRRSGYRWWIERFRRTFELFDVARIDHFRGFAAYWAVPARAKVARRGRWRKGPGADLFRAVEAELGPLPVIAEDLGFITPAVKRLIAETGFPGIVVLEWSFFGGASNPHAPENHRARQVVYTSTHDTDTAVGWFASLSPAERAATGLDPKEPHWGLIERAMASRCALAIVPAQDVLGLGSEARMNTPGRAEGNWRWRLDEGQLDGKLAARLRERTAAGGRSPRPRTTARRASGNRRPS